MKLERRRFEEPDEHRAFAACGQVEIVQIGGADVGRATFEPGWRWSEHVGPLAGTATCHMEHVGYVVSGHQHLRMDDGVELDVGPGDLVAIPPGHDGWTVGEEPCVIIYFGGMAGYATPG